MDEASRGETFQQQHSQEDYFISYENLEVHKVMLEDESRMLTYKNAILNNTEYFKDKVVMDVGCGTGILSIFCAQAGAKKVYAVEASNVANLAEDIIKTNQLENVIEVIHSKVEDAVLPENEKVDAIVSEWMGYYLLHEGMLDSVFAARDKFLKPEGKMFPESAVIYVAPCSVPVFFNNWNEVHGVDMSKFAEQLRERRPIKPEVINIKEEDLMGPEEALCWISLTEDKVANLDYFSLQHVVGATRDGPFHGFCIWFECNFPELTEKNKRVVLDTSPRSPPTHWKQTVIVLPEERILDEGEPIAFKFCMTRSEEDPRRYSIQINMLDSDNVDHPVPCSCYMTKCILVKTLMAQQNEHAIESAKNEVIQEENIDDDSD